MGDVYDRPRRLSRSTSKDRTGHVLVVVVYRIFPSVMLSNRPPERVGSIALIFVIVCRHFVCDITSSLSSDWSSLSFYHPMRPLSSYDIFSFRSSHLLASLSSIVLARFPVSPVLPPHRDDGDEVFVMTHYADSLKGSRREGGCSLKRFMSGIMRRQRRRLLARDVPHPSRRFHLYAASASQISSFVRSMLTSLNLRLVVPSATRMNLDPTQLIPPHPQMPTSFFLCSLGESYA